MRSLGLLGRVHSSSGAEPTHAVRRRLAAAKASPTELHTDRLLLRPFHVGDVDDALAYRDDAEFARFLPHIPQPFTRADAEAFVALNISEPWDRSPTFAVVLGGRVIGTVNLEVDQEAQRIQGKDLVLNSLIHMRTLIQALYHPSTLH